uniref:Uncharacterized protein n=1 Tax=Oryza brachyantha TaxID=4533 RepID=J3KZK8_ORYBR
MESSLLLPQAFTTAMATATATARPCGWRSRPRASSPPHRLVVPSVVCASSSRSALSLHGGGTLAPRHVVPAQEFLLSCCGSWRRDAGTLEEDRPWQRPAGVQWSSGATAPPGARSAALLPMAWAMEAVLGLLGTAQVSLPLLPPEDGAEAHFPFLLLLLLCANPSLQFLRPKPCHFCFAPPRLVPWLAPKQPALPFPPTSRRRLPPCPAGPGSRPPKDTSKSLLAWWMLIWSTITGANKRVFVLCEVKKHPPAEGSEGELVEKHLKNGCG